MAVKSPPFCTLIVWLITAPPAPPGSVFPSAISKSLACCARFKIISPLFTRASTLSPLNEFPGTTPPVAKPSAKAKTAAIIPAPMTGASAIQEPHAATNAPNTVSTAPTLAATWANVETKLGLLFIHSLMPATTSAAHFTKLFSVGKIPPPLAGQAPRPVCPSSLCCRTQRRLRLN